MFDEILVNAVDNKRRNENTSYIKIYVNEELNEISITNDGCGIPVIIHSTEGIYIPTLIFGHLLTSSNYDDSVEKTTGGRNGIGAKLCNLFSTNFTVETSSKLSGYQFKQSWSDNMRNSTTPLVSAASTDDFTRITFRPDLARLSIASIDSEIVSLLHRRAVDIASCLHDVTVTFNDVPIPIHSFRQYVDLFDSVDSPIVYRRFNPNLEVAVAMSQNYAFNQTSFVNGIATTSGGIHVEGFASRLVSKLIDVVKERFSHDEHLVKPSLVRNSLWIFVNAIVSNPAFESQSKECLTSLPADFWNDIHIDNEFITEVCNSGFLEKIEAQISVKKRSLNSRSKANLFGLNIPRLDDAINAGTHLSSDCTLIVTEGNSAKSLALSGLSVLGRHNYGIYPLRGKSLNVRDLDLNRITDNEEFNNLIKILGLSYEKKYLTKESMTQLRYGKVMIMADQDPDGSHIKGLILNFFHYNWPELLQHDYLEQFITPLIKVFKGNNVLSFYSIPEFENWQRSTPDCKKWRVKYYKGLGTSTSAEGKEYFTNIDNHRKIFHYSGPKDDEMLKMAFDKLQSKNRRTWLMKWMEKFSERKDKDLSEENIYEKDVKSISYNDFVNKELVLFSVLDNERSIPSIMDGLKPAQRKVIFTCLKKNVTKEIKVAQLAGLVAEMTGYHHGEMSLNDTITGLAQDFPGSNNINLLVPVGQFGTRVYGGKDSASSRYIFTKLSPIARLIFHPQDENTLTYLTDNNQPIEPKWYVPIIPMILVNGCDGLGTGWKTSIPNYNPLDIIGNLKLIIRGEEPLPMIPWFRNFKGIIKPINSSKYMSLGIVNQVNHRTLEISELPVRSWTQFYKENVLNTFLNEKSKIIKTYEDFNTDTAVKFIIHVSANRIKSIANLTEFLRLKKTYSTENMNLFDENGRIRKFKTPEEILSHFYKVRLPIYDKRKEYIEKLLLAESCKLQNEVRFIEENINGNFSILDIKDEDIISFMIEKKYDSDPMSRWNREQMNTSQAVNTDHDTKRVDHADFNYLLNMPLKSLTRRNLESLKNASHTKWMLLEDFKRKSAQDLWLEDLEILENYIKVNLYKTVTAR